VDTARAGTHWPTVVIVVAGLFAVAFAGLPALMRLGHGRRHLDWAEILQVNLRPGDPWVFLDLSDGTSLPVLGIQPGIARQRAIDDARALRALALARGIQEPDGHRGEHTG